MSITFSQYKAAADRIRRGDAFPGDTELCNAYDAQQGRKEVRRVKSLFDLEVAKSCWSKDGREVER